jgi:hypothetical protein
MKRPAVTMMFLCAVATLSGCPIYDHDDSGCFSDTDCGSGYACDENSGACVIASSSNGGIKSCSKPSDCGADATCTPAASCVSGDCSFSGCVSGYRCDSSTGIWQCISNATGAAGSANEGGSGGEAGALSAATAGAGGDSAAAGASGQAGSN